MYKYSICAYIYLSAQCFMQKSAVNEKICENTKKSLTIFKLGFIMQV